MKRDDERAFRSTSVRPAVSPAGQTHADGAARACCRLRLNRLSVPSHIKKTKLATETQRVNSDFKFEISNSSFLCDSVSPWLVLLCNLNQLSLRSFNARGRRVARGPRSLPKGCRGRACRRAQERSTPSRSVRPKGLAGSV